MKRRCCGWGDDFLMEVLTAKRVGGASPAEGEKGCKPIRIRWILEQAHACHGRCRRLSKGYERLTSSSEAWAQPVATQRMISQAKPYPNGKQAKCKYPEKVKQSAWF